MQKFDVRWYDGFERVFETKRAKFGSDYFWFVDSTDVVNWIPLRGVRRIHEVTSDTPNN